jgi:hypothetical protein
MYYPSGHRRLDAKVQASFVLAELRALRVAISEPSPALQRALAVADDIEHNHDLSRADLFIPALDTCCALLEPFEHSMATGALRQIGNALFPQYVSILGIPPTHVRTALQVSSGGDLVRTLCGAYTDCIVGPDAGALVADVTAGGATITDTSFLPCQLQIGVLLGAGALTGLFSDAALVETCCRSRGAGACAYALAF